MKFEQGLGADGGVLADFALELEGTGDVEDADDAAIASSGEGGVFDRGAGVAEPEIGVAAEGIGQADAGAVLKGADVVSAHEFK